MHRLRAIIAATLIFALVVPSSALAAISSRIWDVTFVDSSKGFMSGIGTGDYGFVSSTTDGGTTWKAVTAPFQYRSMRGVDAFSATSAWTVSSYWDYAWKTASSGGSWSQSTGDISDLSVGARPTDVAHVAANTAVVVGQQPSYAPYGELAAVWRTTDSGANWGEVHSWKKYPQNSDGSYPQAFAEYSAVDADPGDNLLIAVGVERTTDGGGQGFKQTIVARSTNLGATWEDYAGARPNVGGGLGDVSVVSASVAWAAGYNNVQRTTNGGTSWAAATSTPKLLGINGIAATSDQHAIIVGVGGAVRRTTDGGATWKLYTAPSKLDLQSVAILSSTKAIAVGDDQLIVYLALNADGTMTGTEKRATNGSLGDDFTGPTVSLGSPTYSANLTKVTITASDSGSGVLQIEYKVNGGTAKVVSGSSATASLTKIGSNTLTYRAKDRAGNYSGWKSATIKVKSSTAVSLSAPSTSKYRSARLAGRLYDADRKTLYNKKVELQYSYDKRTWKTFATTYTNQKDSKGYKYVYTAKPSKKTYYRARFAGDSSYYSDYSAIDATLPKVYLTRPSFGRSTLAYGKTYKARGYLKPRHKAYSYPVKILAYRYSSGKYRYYKSYSAKAYNYSSYTKYVRSIKLPKKGKWRLRVVHAADSLNAKTYSSYRYVTVK